jgi:hypothetical protein
VREEGVRVEGILRWNSTGRGRVMEHTVGTVHEDEVSNSAGTGGNSLLEQGRREEEIS